MKRSDYRHAKGLRLMDNLRREKNRVMEACRRHWKVRGDPHGVTLAQELARIEAAYERRGDELAQRLAESVVAARTAERMREPVPQVPHASRA